MWPGAIAARPVLPDAGRLSCAGREGVVGLRASVRHTTRRGEKHSSNRGGHTHYSPREQNRAIQPLVSQTSCNPPRLDRFMNTPAHPCIHPFQLPRAFLLACDLCVGGGRGCRAERGLASLSAVGRGSLAAAPPVPKVQARLKQQWLLLSPHTDDACLSLRSTQLPVPASVHFYSYVSMLAMLCQWPCWVPLEQTLRNQRDEVQAEGTGIGHLFGWAADRARMLSTIAGTPSSRVYFLCRERCL